MAEFQCAECGKPFQIGDETLTRFPGWAPRFCMQHRKARTTDTAKPRAGTSGRPAAKTAQRFASGGGSTHGEGDLTPAEVLERYTAGPQDGIFTDGGARPNPGAGGWGFVHVETGRIVAEGHGGEPHTTNNRMELTALIQALGQLPLDSRVTVYSDSDLCVKTLTIWAKGWRARGWRRKEGEIKNLDLVQQAFALVEARPGVRLQWIKAHDGSRWNEYADALATTFLRGG
ncbi:MAG: ribonuclease H family protein [Myxococcota bacterium]